LNRPAGWTNREEALLRSSVAYGQLADRAGDSKCTPLKSLSRKNLAARIRERGIGAAKCFPMCPSLRTMAAAEENYLHLLVGSVLAQQLLVSHYILRGFDVLYFRLLRHPRGSENEGESYKKIAASFSYAPQQFLFVSDAVKEIEAGAVGRNASNPLATADSRATSSAHHERRDSQLRRRPSRLASGLP